MPLDHVTTILQGVPVHAIRGRVDSATAGDMEKALQPLFAETGQRAIVDLSALDYISSAGLRVVLMLAKRAKQTQGRLMLCSLPPQATPIPGTGCQPAEAWPRPAARLGPVGQRLKSRIRKEPA